MHRESAGHEVGSFSKKIKKPKMEDYSDLAKGTDPGLEEGFSEDEVAGEYKKDSSLDKDVAGIAEGLDKAGVMIAAEKEEENEWKEKISAAKQKIAAAERRVELKGKVQAGTEARQKAVESISQRTVAAEAKENEKWENAEWQAKTKVAEDKEEVRSILTRLKERLGFGKKKEKQ